MRVLHVTEACGAGVRRHLELILPALVGRGLSCGLLAFGNRIEAGFAGGQSGLGFCRIVPLAGSRLRNLPRYASLIRAACEEWRPDVVHLHAFTAGLAGRLTSLPNRPKVVYSPHAFGFDGSVGLPRRMAVWGAEKSLRRRADGFVLVGDGELEAARRLGIEEGRLHLAPNGIGEIRFCTREEARVTLGIAPGELAGVAPCRLEPQKGLSTLLKALPHAACHLYLFGEGSQTGMLRRLVDKLHLEGRVEIRPPLDNLRELLRAFDFGVLPSLYEGRSYALLEMLRAGIPVIASDIPANRLPGVQAGLTYFPPGDADALAALLEAPPPPLGAENDALPPDCSLENQIASLATIYEGVINDGKTI